MPYHPLARFCPTCGASGSIRQVTRDASDGKATWFQCEGCRTIFGIVAEPADAALDVIPGMA